MAELSEDEKNRISHRAKALAAMRPRLEATIRARQAEAEGILEQHPGRNPTS